MKATCTSSFCASRLIFILFILSAIPVFSGIAPHAFALETAQLETGILPAKGTVETFLTVPGFGRYAIMVKSPQGSALQLIDRMAGPGDVFGVPGENDGRVDTFLDRGRYKIRIHSHENGSGQAQLTVHPFEEINTPRPPRLVEYKRVDSQLADFQQRAYWMEIKNRDTVAIEAAGRSLADLRLWKDGNWLVDAAPLSEVVEPRKGKPLTVKRLAARLNPGLYQVIAYGGPALPWAETSDESPLHLKWGIPTLAEAGRGQHTTGPLGSDRYLVPRTATYFRLEIPEAEGAAITVIPYNPGNPFSGSGQTARISKESLPPAAEIFTDWEERGYYMVTIHREAGAPYIFQHFESSAEYHFNGSGRYWISTLHSGHLQDSADATSLLIEAWENTGERLLKSRTITLDPRTGWKGRFNLMSPLTLFLEVSQSGKFSVSGDGVRARYRIEPFFTTAPDNYEPPDFEPGGHVWPLDPGFFVLTAFPENNAKGILDLEIAPDRLFGASTQQPRRFAGRYPDVQLDSGARYTLYMNQQPEVRTGVVLRRLPVDLTHALPVTQHTGETVSVQVSVPDNGDIRAVAEDGRELPLSVDRNPEGTRHTVSPGIHTVHIRHDDPDPVQYNLRFDAVRLAAETPLPEISEDLLAAIPRFNPLTENQPFHLDIQRNEIVTFQVRVDEDDLYQLESTGLLETEGNIRTRTIVSYDRRAANGVGRNFLIQQYLRQGDYQLSIRSRGITRGHLGVEISRTPLIDGGRLAMHIPARRRLAAGEGVVYRFRIPEKGRYRLQTLGQNRRFLCRLEDEAGWPLAAPGSPADFDMTFSPGTFRLVLLPQAVEARSVTLLEPIPPPPRREGHGPHFIRLNTPVRHVWMEPETGKDRTPDQWCFSIPAPVDAEIRLSAEMTGVLVKKEGEKAGKSLPPLSPGKRWTGRMPAGDYCLEVASLRPNNRLEYELTVESRQLVAGYERRITAPGEIVVSVGETHGVEFSSLGRYDVRARLFDAQGTLLAKNDDQAADWNFHLAPTLEPGEYRLAVEPVGMATAETIVRMHQPEAVLEPALSLPIQTIISDTRLHTYPLQLSEGNGLFLATARSDDTVGLSLEVREDEGWRQLGYTTGADPILTVPQGPDPHGRPLRLRAWSVDRRGAEITLQAGYFHPDPQTEAEMSQKGLRLTPLGHADLHWGLFTVELERPGLFQFDRPLGELRIAAAPDRQLMPVEGSFPATGNRIWGMTRMDNRPLRGQRMGLQPDQPLHLTLPQGREARIDLPPMEPGRTLLIHAESRSGTPGISVEDRQGRTTPVLMGVDGNAAVTIATGTSHTMVHLWRADAGSGELPVTLRAVPFSGQERIDLTEGIIDMALTHRVPATVELPGGNIALKLTLPARTAAALVRDDRSERLVWTGEEPRVHTLTTSARRLILYYDGRGSAMASLSSTALTSGSRTGLDPEQIFSDYFSEKGAHHMDVKVPNNRHGNGYHIVVRGSETIARFMDHDGRIFTGTRIPVDKDGVLALFHAGGVAAAWLEGSDIDPWSISLNAPPMPVTAAGPVALNGMGAAFTIHRRDPAMLHLNIACPVMTHIKTGKTPSWTDLFEHGADLALYLPPGTTEVLLIAPGQGRLSGDARFSFTAVTPITEGLGPRVRLAPGDARLFSFTADVPGKVGVGVRGTSDRAICRLITLDGVSLGSGRVQMHDLSPGRYFLAVENPPGEAPLEIRPAVVGIRPPEKGPPEAVIRHYMEMSESGDAAP